MSPIEASEFDDRTTASKLRVTVTVDLFSGLSAPTWELEDCASETVIASLSRLSRTDRRGPEPPGLGYRGLLLRIEKKESVQEYQVYGGIIVRGSERLIDAGRLLERFIIKTGERVISEDLSKEILDQF